MVTHLWYPSRRSSGAVDSHHYGKLVIAPLNIVLYNVFSSHGANLYGSEPWTFYFLNLALNFNIALIASAAALPAMIICRFLSNRKHLVTIHHWIVMASLVLWITLFTVQKHKEERFMFPIFPLICLSAGISIEIGSKLISSYSLRLSNIYSNFIFHPHWCLCNCINFKRSSFVQVFQRTF